MRVLHAIWSLEIGGAETMLVDIVNRQSRSADVGLLVGNSVVDRSLLPGIAPAVRVIPGGRPPGSRNPWWLLRLYSRAARFRPDVIHCHVPSLVAALPLPRARKLLTVHDTGVQVEPWAHRYDRIISISRAVQADLAGRRPSVNSQVVYNGIDFSAIEPRERRRQAGRFRLVQVSRLLAAKKGQDLLLHALAAVAAGRGADAFEVDFIGDGPDRDALAQQARELGLEGNCRFLGSMSRQDVYAALPGYDLLVQPSRFEGFGLTVVEGVAAGLAVLCSDLEGPREILDFATAGYRFRPDDAEDCARQILRVMDEAGDPAFPGLLAADREELRARFDIDAVAGAYLDHYRALVGT